MDRRKFFTLAGLGTLGLASKAALGAGDPSKLPRLPAYEPLEGTRWAMLVDLDAVAEQGFDKCVEACDHAHNIPNYEDKSRQVKWIWGESFYHALHESYHKHFAEKYKDLEVPVFCNHCDNPPCTRVCPTQATWKREDGVVMMDWHRCIGCRYCVAACPYGSRSFNWTDPREKLEAEGRELNKAFPTREKGVVEKCNFCEERLALGQIPACAEACVGDDKPVLVFGDLGDADSEVRAILRERPAIRRKPGLGTEPEVYYVL